ncbi:hypothetical protein [Nocardia sp. NPDC057353]|uniref:DoxX family protein n=1 Tax=Nocardia sp. NPDC057353 TaxID=3346104 RepID=UPI00364049F3
MATTTDAARRPALLLAAGLAGAGVMHFVTPKFFDSIVPPVLPGQARTYTYASGVAELAVAGTLAVPRTRGLGGKLAALLFLAVFPANVQMAVDVVTNPKTTPLFKLGSILRLPLQIPMITTALSVSRNARG